ncbi:MAG: endonuclease NucS domain-containing protein [Betaproteobacteria bacterium]
MKKFVVVTSTQDGGVELHAMKEWLRQHQDQVPAGHDATLSTSHQLRLALKKNGWVDQDTGTEIRLIHPGTANSASIESVLGQDGSEDAVMGGSEDVGDASFALEHQLRDFIAQNIESIPVNGRRLRLYVDATGKDGVEFSTAVGSIDILAVDKETNALVVFELKRGRTPDHVIGPIARYMGWLKSTITKDVEVRGVIVAKQIAQNLRYAIKAVPNVSLFEYEVSFTLRAAASV